MILIWKSEKLLRPQCGKLVIKCRNRMTNNSVKTMIVKWPATTISITLTTLILQDSIQSMVGLHFSGSTFSCWLISASWRTMMVKWPAALYSRGYILSIHQLFRTRSSLPSEVNCTGDIAIEQNESIINQKCHF